MVDAHGLLDTLAPVSDKAKGSKATCQTGATTKAYDCLPIAADFSNLVGVAHPGKWTDASVDGYPYVAKAAKLAILEILAAFSIFIVLVTIQRISVHIATVMECTKFINNWSHGALVIANSKAKHDEYLNNHGGLVGKDDRKCMLLFQRHGQRGLRLGTLHRLAGAPR